ncbi:MAG TPA: hypothetical protein VFD31_12235 [Thermoleophilaceae bacterium]|nr:hypothetical protein [Thermoleophilaceae bacterium]
MFRSTLALFVGLMALVIACPATADAAVNFQVRGQWTCKDGSTVAPIAGARIELWRHRSYFPDQKITRRYTGSDGSYDINVNASDNFTLYIKLLLRDDRGVELENWYSPFTWETETSKRRSRAGVVDLGTWQVSRGGAGSPKCAIWQGAHNAYGDYRTVVGAAPPMANYRIDADFPCCGTPFTTRDTTRWPSGYPVGAGYSVSSHEFAHAFRHTFDGSFAHFSFDVARFQYPQNHTPCKLTNEGFAFNEGWAEYWANTPDDCGDGTNYSQEGNVAAALTGLERCTDRASMVRVLRQHPGDIHSYPEFRSRFFQTFGQMACSPVPATAPGATSPILTRRLLVADLRNQIAAQRKLTASLSRQGRRADRRAQAVGPCSAGGCQPAMEKLIAPSALDAQAAQAKLVLKRLNTGLAVARKANLGADFSKSKLVNRLPAGRRAFSRASLSILIGGLREGIRDIKTEPGLKAEGSTNFFRTLESRLSTLTRARKRGRGVPAGLQSLFAPPIALVDVTKKVKAVPITAPAPTPVPDADTTLSQSCPEMVNTNAGPPFTVSGQLKPAPAAASIRLVYTRPDATSFTRSTTVDANGNWSHTIDPEQEDGGGTTFGAWGVQSNFDGSARFRPSQSSTCTVVVND